MFPPHRLPALLAALLIGVIGTAAPAAAHPFGPPSTAKVTVDGTNLRISWLAAEDDWVALGQSVGAFADQSNDLTGEEKLQRSPAVRDYLLKHITVTQQGRGCPGTVDALENLMQQGARLSFTCPAPISELDLTLAALTDLNESYRTVLTPDTKTSPGQVMFTAAQSTQHVRFLDTAGGPPAAVVTLATATGVLVLAAAALLLYRARRRVVTV